MSKIDRNRFEAKVQSVPESGCWLWAGAWDKYGYGKVWVGGKFMLAHRASWQLHCGPLPAGAIVCHKCDTPSCVNPGHLFLGTPADNVRDRHAKGRCARGRKQGLAKLTDEIVRDIYLANGVQAEIADRFGIHQSQVSNIKRRATWAHATEGLIA